MQNVIIILLSIVGGIILLGIFLFRYCFHQKFVDKPSLSGMFISNRIYVQGLTRSYSYYLPDENKKSVDVIFVLHGAADNGTIFRKRLSYLFDFLADQQKNVVIIYPDGYKKSWNDCRLMNTYPSRKKEIDDISFLKEIEKELANHLKTKIGKRFFFGFSNGGQMVNRICLEQPDWVDGATVVAASLPIKENMVANESGKFVPMMLVNGTDDKTNPFYGGEVNVLGIKKLGNVCSAQETLKYWEGLQQSSSMDKTGSLSSFIIEGGGHTIPNYKSKFPRILGETNMDVCIVTEAMNFFRQLNNINHNPKI